MGLHQVLKRFLAKSSDQLVREFQSHQVHPVDQVNSTFKFLSDVASGKTPTTATYIRGFIAGHPEYKHDSVLSEVACS